MINYSVWAVGCGGTALTAPKLWGKAALPPPRFPRPCVFVTGCLSCIRCLSRDIWRWPFWRRRRSWPGARPWRAARASGARWAPGSWSSRSRTRCRPGPDRCAAGSRRWAHTGRWPARLAQCYAPRAGAWQTAERRCLKMTNKEQY